ncbi:hypothetical protein JG688_00013302, partial [Phytophthora aleatoria]
SLTAVCDLREIATPQPPLSQWELPKVVTRVRPASYRISYELIGTVNDVMCVSVLMTLDTYGYFAPSAMFTCDDTSVDRVLVPPSNIYGASAATSLILAASLTPFESSALITELTIDDNADTYGLIRGVSQHCQQ